MSCTVDREQLAEYAGAPDAFDFIPLHPWDARDSDGDPIGKKPVDFRWTETDYSTPEQRARIAEWIEAGGNVGTRPRAGWLVFDYDPARDPDGFEWAEFLGILREDGLSLEDFASIKTGSGGLHIWARAPEGNLVRRGRLLDLGSIEVKNERAQVVAAGSRHPNGNYYRWQKGCAALAAVAQIGPALTRRAYRPRRAAGSAGATGQLTPAQVAGLLDQLDVTAYRDHDAWRDIGFACWHATGGSPEGLAAFVAWSTGDPRHRDAGDEIAERWDTWEPEGVSDPITAGTLLKAVRALEDGVIPEDVERAMTGSGIDLLGPYEDPPEGLDAPPAVQAAAALAEVVAAGGGDDLDLMQRQFLILTDRGHVSVARWHRDDGLNIEYLERLKKEHFQMKEAHRFVERGEPDEDGKVERVATTRLFLTSADTRRFEGVTLRPNQPERVETSAGPFINLWRGWGVEPRSGRWPLFERVLREAICAGNEAHYGYVLDWMAWGVCHPDRLAEVAIVLRGGKGTGKGTFGRLGCLLYGTHGWHASNPEHLVGRFNGHIENALFFFADEALYAGGHREQAILKQLITEPDVVVEQKFLPAKQVPNRLKIVMASNSEWVVQASGDERRFAIFDVAPVFVGPAWVDFWKAVNREIDTGGAAAFLHDMLARGKMLGDWHPRQSVPTTPGLIDQITQTMPPLERWLVDLGNEDAFPCLAVSDWTIEGGDVLAEDLFRVARQEMPKGSRDGEHSMRIALGRALGKLADVQRVRGGGEGRPYVYRIPDRADYRRRIEVAIAKGKPLAWRD